MRSAVLTFLAFAACRPSSSFRYVDLPSSVPRATQPVVAAGMAALYAL